MNISYDGQAILLTFPSPLGARPHTVSIPIERCGIACNEFGTMFPNQRGWAVLLDVLKAQHREEKHTHLIGTKAAPVKYDLEKMLKAIKVVGKSKRKLIPEATLEDLGL